jgi:hypothetical protein
MVELFSLGTYSFVEVIKQRALLSEAHLTNSSLSDIPSL